MKVIINSREARDFHKFLAEQKLTYEHETRKTPDEWYTRFNITSPCDKAELLAYMHEKDIDFATDIRHGETGVLCRGAYDEEFNWFYEVDEDTDVLHCSYDDLDEAVSSLMCEKEYLGHEGWEGNVRALSATANTLLLLSDDMYDYIGVQKTTAYDDLGDSTGRDVAGSIDVYLILDENGIFSMDVVAKGEEKEFAYMLVLTDKEMNFFKKLTGRDIELRECLETALTREMNDTVQAKMAYPENFVSETTEKYDKRLADLDSKLKVLRKEIKDIKRIKEDNRKERD